MTLLWQGLLVLPVSIRTGQPACDLNTTTRVQTLHAQGCDLPQERPAKEITRP